MHKFKILPLFVIVLLLSVGIAGCTTADYSTAKPLPSLTFNHLNPYSVNSGATRITQSFQSGDMTRQTSLEFGKSPASLLKQYANQRFITSGAPQTFVFNIKKAKLSKTSSNTDALNFMVGLSLDVYKMEILLELSLLHPNGKKAQPHNVYYEQKLTLSSNVTLKEREYAQFEFYEKMITDIDRAVSDIIQNKL